MPAVYARCLQLADWWLARSRVTLLAAAVLAVGLVVSINQFVLRDFPNSGDEYVYLYEAETLARGQVVTAAPHQPQSFAFNYIVYDRGRAYGTFPAGWPLVLAGAVWLKLPTFLVNPILGMLSLMLIAGVGRRLHSARVGVLAALIVGATPFFLFNAASYFSHTLCGFLLLAAAYLASREDRRPAWVPIGVGFLIGWAVATRYFTGIVCGLPIIAWLLRPGVDRVRTLVMVVAGGVPSVGLLASYNDALTGSPWTLTTQGDTVSKWFADRFMLRGADILATQILRFVLWTPPFLLAAYVAYLVSAPRHIRRGVLHWMMVAVAVGFYCFIERGGNQYGPRFYYEAFLFLAIFVVANLFQETSFVDKSTGGRRLFALVAISVAVLPAILVTHAIIEHRVVQERMSPFDMSRAADIAAAMVFIKGRVGTARSMAASDLTRNGITYSDSVLYALDLGQTQNCLTLEQYAGRRGYLYAWDARARSGSLRPVSCGP